MKGLAVLAGATLMLAGQLSPVFASSTAPTISIRGLEPATVGTVIVRKECAKPASIGTPYWVMPAIAAEQGVSGTAQVKVDLNPAGELVHAAIYSSSGNPWLDEAAITSAKMTQFTAEVVDCHHVGGSYLYDVEF